MLRNTIRILLTVLLCVGGALLRPEPALAQVYPNRPIKIVVPFPAGGPTDGMARIISDRLGTVLGQSIIIENRGGGAGGSVGAKVVASADPDGYTILLTPGGSLTTGPAVHKNIGYDPLKAFVPVGLVMETPQTVSVHPDLPVKTMAELVAYAKANPGKISFGSQGFGVGPHLMLELFKLEAGIKMTHVPYRGTAPMLTALLTGEVQTRHRSDHHQSDAHPVGQDTRACGRVGDPHAGLAERADHRRSGLSEAGVAILAWRGGAGRHAARHRRQAQRRVSRSSWRAGNARQAGELRRRGQDRHAGGVRQADRQRARVMAGRRQGRQHHRGVMRGA